jgi:intracellular multiplication protein IcmJ
MIYRLNDASDAKNIYRSFKLRAQMIEEKIGEGLSNPAQFGQLLIDANAGEQKPVIQEEILKAFRLLPNMIPFSTEIMSWARAGLEECFYSR